jgi:PKD repeat protein
MKKKLLLSFLAMISMLLHTYSQRFQVTTGNQKIEEKWAVVEDPITKNYVTIGNQGPLDDSRVWISSYNLNGTLVTSALASNGRSMIARDISLAPTQPGEKPSYYITGWTNRAGTNSMFVGRIDLNGAFLWYQENPLTADGLSKEGVAIVTARNGDAVAVGNIDLGPNNPGGMQVYMARFTAAGGALQWGLTHYQRGRWMVREIATGVPDPNCPNDTEDNFIITGEAYETEQIPGPVTFAAVYTGNGQECWRNLYPAKPDNVDVTGDAGYDVVYEPRKGTYCVVGVAETQGQKRNTQFSTPYILNIAPGGALLASAVYTAGGSEPLGAYPRAVTLDGGQTGAVVFSGPDFRENKVFLGLLPNLGPPLPIGRFVYYNGPATANSYPQPYWFNDAQPEGILFSRGDTDPGYVISSNAWPVGVFGFGDGHLIKTDVNLATPNDCSPKEIQNDPQRSEQMIPVFVERKEDLNWGEVATDRQPYDVEQKFCSDPAPCVIGPASFTFTGSGLSYNFFGSGSGSGTLSWAWNFGDPGSGINNTSTLQNPSHLFTTSGNYNVCLTVTNTTASGVTCSTTVCQVIKVCNVKANFKDSIVCKTVYYTSTSTGSGPLTYNWLFDDGSTSTLANPIKTYTLCGLHVVRLIVCNPTCCDTIIKTTNIPCCTATSDFCLTNYGRVTTLSYTAVAGTSYSVFLNGGATVWANNTTKTLTAGSNTVCVRATRILCGDTCCATTCKTISVSDTCTLSGNFWFQVRTNGQVVFANQTTPAGFTSFWQFGDPGNTTSTLASPTFTYTLPGTYTACLTVKRPNGTDTCEEKVCKTIVIDPACNVQAQFKATHCTATPLNVVFANMSSGGSSYLWSFGDPASGINNTSTLASPNHVFTAPGTYYVCLQTLVNSGCWSKSCYRVVVSSVTSNTSCTLLPGSPLFRLGTEIAENEVTLVETVTSDGKAEAAKAAAAKPVLQKGTIVLFPNPASQKVQVVFAAENAGAGDVWLLNAEGMVVYKKIIAVAKGSNQLSVPVTLLPSGIYHIRIQTGSTVIKNHFMVNNQ